jgi:membrane protein required for colicin V production
MRDSDRRGSNLMNGADLVILILLTISSLVGLVRGLVKEVLSLVNWVVALAVAFIFKSSLAAALPFPDSASPVVRELGAAGLLFFATLILGVILVHALGELIKATGLTGTDRILGFGFGLVRGLVIVLAALIFLPALMPVAESSWWSESTLIPGFLQFEGWARELLGTLLGWITSFFN